MIAVVRGLQMLLRKLSSSDGSWVQHGTACGCKLFGAGVLAQVSFDTGEFVAKHFWQAQCANFVARLVSHCLLRSLTLLDKVGVSAKTPCALVWAEWADSGQGRWPAVSLGASAVVPLSTPSPLLSGGARVSAARQQT